MLASIVCIEGENWINLIFGLPGKIDQISIGSKIIIVNLFALVFGPIFFEDLRARFRDFM